LRPCTKRSSEHAGKGDHDRLRPDGIADIDIAVKGEASGGETRGEADPHAAVGVSSRMASTRAFEL
jgi:hypothetical protein